MIIMRLKGGLGNQLFQYSTAYAFAKTYNLNIYFDFYDTNHMSGRSNRLSALLGDNIDILEYADVPLVFNIIKNKYINKFLRIIGIEQVRIGDYNYCIEGESDYVYSIPTPDAKYVYYDGYFQSDFYFKIFRKELINNFNNYCMHSDEFLELHKQIKDSMSVAVHVRRGDFIHDSCKYHYLLDQEYYHKAFSYLDNSIKDYSVFWFSDDTNWVKSVFCNISNSTFVKLESYDSDIEELHLMKECKHIICANSTFSWWAAWLNEDVNSIKIVPRRDFGKKNMIPESWIKL